MWWVVKATPRPLYPEKDPVAIVQEVGWEGYMKQTYDRSFTGAIVYDSRGQVKCDGTRAETIFRLSAKRTSPFKPAGASVQLTTGSRGVRIISSNAG